MQTRTITACIPANIADQIDQIAKQSSRSRDWHIEQALLNWVALQERRHQMILEALQEVDEGNVIPHEDIKAWAATLK